MPCWTASIYRIYAACSRSSGTATVQASQFLATQAFSIGQDTFQFVISFGVMLYLLFFLLRDGAGLSRSVSRAIPAQRGRTSST